MAKLTALQPLTDKLYNDANKAQDYDRLAESVFRGARAKVVLSGGQVLQGKITAIMNQGFNGQQVQIRVTTKGEHFGQIRQARIDRVRVWA